jgi:tetratricopeptide (TPR) repeat protein
MICRGLGGLPLFIYRLFYMIKKIGFFLFVMMLVVGCGFWNGKKTQPESTMTFEEGVTTISETSGIIIKEIKTCSLYTDDEDTLSAKKRILQKAINDVAPTFGVMVTGTNSFLVDCVKEKNQETEQCVEKSRVENEQTVVENSYTIQRVTYPIIDKQNVCVAVIVKKMEQKSGDSSVEEVPKNSLLFDGYQFLRAGELDKAQQKFSQAQVKNPRSAEPLYWQARLALARDRQQNSLYYLEEALKYDSEHVHSLALKMKVLLLMGGQHIQQGKQLAQSVSVSHSSPVLKKWSRCISELSGFIITETDINSRCQSLFPVYQFSQKY